MSRNSLNKFRKQHPDVIWQVTQEQKAHLDWFFEEPLRYAYESNETSEAPHVHLPRLSSEKDKANALLSLMAMAKEQYLAEQQANEEAN
jgi:hypothetical protein